MRDRWLTARTRISSNILQLSHCKESGAKLVQSGHVFYIGQILPREKNDKAISGHLNTFSRQTSFHHLSVYFTTLMLPLSFAALHGVLTFESHSWIISPDCCPSQQ